MYESPALIGEHRIIDYDEYCKTLTRLKSDNDLNDYFHSDIESVKLSNDEQEVMNKCSKNITDDDDNDQETHQERNHRYREMLIETMSKYSKRKYVTVNNARKESVDQTQNDTSINSDEQNNEKVPKMNETVNSSPRQILLISTPSIYIPDIPPLVNTSPYKSTDPFEVV